MSPERPFRDVSLWGDQFPALLDAAKAGADWAWADLYDALAPMVLGYLRGRRVPEPEDVLGETFLHAFRSISTFQGDERALRTWVLGIAHRRLVDDVRYRARRPAAPAPVEEIDSVAGSVPDASQAAVDRVEVARALDAIRSLSSDQQDVIILRFVSDLTLQETAEVLGKRLSAVKALQRRGLASLQRAISKQGVSP